MCKISIIIPVYNVEPFVGQCLQSVVKQNRSDIEIIVVDDGSTDSSLNICKEYASKYSYVNLISQKNGGVSEARNTGIKKAVGEYIMFLDSDDYLDDCALFKVIEFLSKKNPDVLLIDNREVVEDGSFYAGAKFKEKLEYLNCETDKIPEIPSGVWRLICKNRFISENSLFFYKGIIHEDDEWVPRVLTTAKTFAYLNYAVYVYRKRKGSVMHSPKSFKHFFGKYTVFMSLLEYGQKLQEVNKRKYMATILAANLNVTLNLMKVLSKKEKTMYFNNIKLKKSEIKRLFKNSNMKGKFYIFFGLMFGNFLINVYSLLRYGKRNDS